MKLFNKVAIIGTGLIGGSLALDIKRQGLALEVVGVSRKEKSIRLAKAMGAIDSGATALKVAKDADLVVLATSVDSIIALGKQLANILKKETIVTDVGSTKVKIVSELERLFPVFVGSHPLAGSEKKSIANAQAGLFKGSTCILTPTIRTDSKALHTIKKMWQKIGARVITMPPKQHDRILSFTSHLPHTVAFALINSIPSDYLNYSAAGLRDTTRIALSDSQLWTEVLLSNKNMAHALGCLEVELRKLRKAIMTRNHKILQALLRKAQKKRENLYIRDHKTAAFRLQMEHGRSVFRSKKPRTLNRGAS